VTRQPPVFVVRRRGCVAALRAPGLELDAVTSVPPDTTRPVIVLPDASASEREQARQLAAQLLDAVVVDLHPGEDTGATVADWLGPVDQDEERARQARRALVAVVALTRERDQRVIDEGRRA
jgi:hypothetical protein